MRFMSILCFIFVYSQCALASLNIGTYNIRNFDYDDRSHISTNKQHLINQFKKINADLLAVQEIRETHVFNNMIHRNFNFYDTVFTQCGGSHDQKLGFIYNTQKLKLIDFQEDSRTVLAGGDNQRQSHCSSGSRPLAVAKFKRRDNGEVFTAISVHLKAGGRPKNIRKRFRQIKMIHQLVNEFKSAGENNYIILGDFNSTEYIHRSSEARKQFDSYVNKMDAVDLSSGMNCSSYWWGGVDDNHQYPSLLDHILISNDMLADQTPKAQKFGHCAQLSCQVTPEQRMGVSFDEVSDHCPQTVTLK